MPGIQDMLAALLNGGKPPQAPMQGSIASSGGSAPNSPYGGIQGIFGSPPTPMGQDEFATAPENQSRQALAQNTIAGVNKQAIDTTQPIHNAWQGISMLANKAASSNRLQELFNQMRNTNQLNGQQQANQLAPAFGMGQAIPPPMQQQGAWGTTVIPEPNF